MGVATTWYGAAASDPNPTRFVIHDPGIMTRSQLGLGMAGDYLWGDCCFDLVATARRTDGRVTEMTSAVILQLRCGLTPHILAAIV